MSFSLHVESLITDAVSAVEAAASRGDQFEAVRAFVLAELAVWPTGEGAPNGVLIDVAGHHDETSRNVTIVMRPQRIGPPED